MHPISPPEPEMPDAPLTVFVPSNEALRRIPDEELEVIKNNSTALKGKPSIVAPFATSSSERRTPINFAAARPPFNPASSQRPENPIELHWIALSGLARPLSGWRSGRKEEAAPKGQRAFSHHRLFVCSLALCIRQAKAKPETRRLHLLFPTLGSFVVTGALHPDPRSNLDLVGWRASRPPIALNDAATENHMHSLHHLSQWNGQSEIDRRMLMPCTRPLSPPGHPARAHCVGPI